MDMPTNIDNLIESSQLLQKGRIGREATLYEVLQIDTTANKTKVREAYIRLKHAYSGQSQALYSLLDDDAARRSMAEIEEAFKVLNDDILRKEYDDKLQREGILVR